MPAAQAATFETVARNLDNPRGVAVGPDGAVYVANAGRAGRQCEGRGEDAECFGATGRIVRVLNGRKRTVASGFASFGGPGSVFAGPLHGVSVAPDGTVFAVTGSATPREIRGAPPLARRQAGRLFTVGGGDFDVVARIDRLEHRENLDGVPRDRNSNPYAMLALSADHQIVVDAGANAVLQVRNGEVSLLVLIPRRGGAQAVPTSIAQGPGRRVLRRPACRRGPEGQGPRVARARRGRRRRGVPLRLHGDHRRGLRGRRDHVRHGVRA